MTERDRRVAAGLRVRVLERGEQDRDGRWLRRQTPDRHDDVRPQRRRGGLEPRPQRRESGGADAADGARRRLGEVVVGQQVDERVDLAEAGREARVPEAFEHVVDGALSTGVTL